MSTLFVPEAPPCPHIRNAEKDEAREIQNSLLPSGTLRNAFIEIAYRFSPFGEAGGDFADFFILPNGMGGSLYRRCSWQRSGSHDVYGSCDGNVARHQ